MKIAIRHLRSLAIALVALALSAGLTLGAAAPQASFGLAKAASHTGTTAGSGDVVTAGEDEESGEETDEDTDEDAAGDEDAEEDGDGGENCLVDPTDPATDLTTLTHGQIVCWAAHQETPEGYKNHGEWVSSWAKGEQGAPEAASGQGHGKAKGKNKHQD